ncbi:MAG: FAD-dependent oxidoreductase, partial [Pseudomonadota bacterium]
MVQTDVAQTEKSHTDFDLFVIGGGSGGVRAARIAATHGARVGIAEEYRYGGTCVIRGCVPKKLYVYASRFAEAFSTSRAFGWQPGEAAFSWPDLVGAKEQEITRLENIYADNLKKSGVRVFQERAQFVDAHTVKLTASGDTIKAGKFLIATGGRPSMDTSIPGHEYAISSNEAFDLPKLPRQIVIYGGGYIAVEFAGIFSGLGVETTLVYRGQQFLRGFDDDMRDHVETAYRNRGVNIVYGQTIQAIEKDGEAYVAKLSGGESVACDQVMFAIGRLPNTDGLGLDSAGVETSKKGAIQVDDSSKTNVDHIYAVGDVTDRVQLTPVAIREGHA